MTGKICIYRLVATVRQQERRKSLRRFPPFFMNNSEYRSLLNNKKYEIADKCKYYLAQLDGDMAAINDVSDSTETIYKLLAKPFQDLENVRYEND